MLPQALGSSFLMGGGGVNPGPAPVSSMSLGGGTNAGTVAGTMQGGVGNAALGSGTLSLPAKPAAAPAALGGGGGGGTTQTAPAALTPAQIAQAQATTDFNNNLGTINSTTGASIAGAGSDYKNSVQDFLDSLTASQKGIDSEAVQNELARQNGHQGVLDMVHNGIQSGGTMIGNAGGGTSSAGEALARAYSLLGRQQESSVGNQAAQGQNKVNTDEAALVASAATGTRDTQQKKVDTINSIVSNAQQQLTYLNQQAAYASIPDRVNIDQQIATIRQQALDALGSYDAQLSAGVPAATSGMGQPAVQAKATQLQTAGVAPASEFNYTASTPMAFQDTGPFASGLPIFNAPSASNKNNNNLPAALAA